MSGNITDPTGANGTMPMPTGPVENLGPQAETITWVVSALTLVFLALRLYCKWLKSRGLWYDDYLLTISTIFLVIDGIILSLNVREGFGMHLLDLIVVKGPTAPKQVAFYSYLAGTFSILGAVWSKTAFALTLLRIAEERWFKGIIWFIIVTMNILMTLNAIFAFVQCNPPEKVWDINLPGSCWDPQVYSDFGIATGVYSGLMDIALAMLPWKIIWGLQMKLAEKLGVAIAMSMGLIAGATAFVKSAQIPALASGDFSYYGYGLVVWGSCEVAATIIAACIPVLRVLVRDVKASATRKYGNSGGGTRLPDDNMDSKMSRHGGTQTDTQRSNTVVVGSGAGAGGGGNAGKLGRRGSTSFSRPFGGAKAGASANANEVHGDDWSERSIFRDDQMGNKIHTTHEVKVEYHPRDMDMTDGSDHSRELQPRRDEYEMGRVV